MSDLNITQEDIKFLKELQHELVTQDHVCQASPRFWIVQGTVKEYGYDSEYSDDCCIVLDCETGINNMREAYDFMESHVKIHTLNWDEDSDMIDVFDENNEEIANLDALEDVCDFIEKYNIGKCNDGVYPYMCYYKNVEKNFENTMFLTNRECKEHIRLNHYHYPSDAHSYAMTAWRAPQVSKLWDILDRINWTEIEKLL